MRKIYTTFVLCMFATIAFAQGIAVQGIARDVNDAALVSKRLPFQFFIYDAGGTLLFSETQSITTDTYGLFSHVVGSGSATESNFNNIDFSLQGLKLAVWVEYLGDNVEVYNQSLQHVPYAHYAKKAANGVPPGTVVAFMGGDDVEVPEGWVKCDGSDITSKGSEYNALKAVIGNILPDLRGRFLKGYGKGGNIPSNQIETGVVGDYQGQLALNHRHYIDVKTYNGGQHYHDIKHRNYGSPSVTNDKDAHVQWGQQDSGDRNGNSSAYRTKYTADAGNHNHTIKDWTLNNEYGGKENRPWTAIVNYIIKL